MISLQDGVTAVNNDGASPHDSASLCAAALLNQAFRGDNRYEMSRSNVRHDLHHVRRPQRFAVPAALMTLLAMVTLMGALMVVVDHNIIVAGNITYQTIRRVRLTSSPTSSISSTAARTIHQNSSGYSIGGWKDCTSSVCP
jgi:hypothetical protein